VWRCDAHSADDIGHLILCMGGEQLIELIEGRARLSRDICSVGRDLSLPCTSMEQGLGKGPLQLLDRASDLLR
jgi:hypothetical protein